MVRPLVIAIGVGVAAAIAFEVFSSAGQKMEKICSTSEVLDGLKSKIHQRVDGHPFISAFYIKSTTTLSSSENQASCLALIGVKLAGSDEQHRVRYTITKDDQGRLSMNADVSPVTSMYLDPEDR